MANPPILNPGNWGRDQTLFLTITKTGRDSDPFVYKGSNDKGDFWVWRVEVTDGNVDQEFGRERSLFPGDYLHDLLMKLHGTSAIRVGSKLAVTKQGKEGSSGHTWIVEFAGEQPQPSGASVDTRDPAPPPAPRQAPRTQAPAAFNPYRFETRDKFATPIYTRKQAEEIARWAVNLADTVAAPGVIESVEDSRIIVNTTERRWNDERARQSNIATWVILAKEIVPTDFGPGYGPPPDLEISKAQFWNLVQQSDADGATVGGILIDLFEPENGDGGKLTVWNYLTALVDIEKIIALALEQEPEPDPEPDPNVDPDPVEDIDEPADAGVSADDIPFGY